MEWDFCDYVIQHCNFHHSSHSSPFLALMKQAPMWWTTQYRGSLIKKLRMASQIINYTSLKIILVVILEFAIHIFNWWSLLSKNALLLHVKCTCLIQNVPIPPSHPCDNAITLFTFLDALITQSNVTIIKQLSFKSIQNLKTTTTTKESWGKMPEKKETLFQPVP